jgi:diacylglycerol kinase (ATP)
MRASMGGRAHVNLFDPRHRAAAAEHWIRAGMAIDCAATRSPREPSAFIEAMERLLRATINTWHGLVAAARSEEAFRQELIALILAVPLAFLLAGEAWKRLALIGVVVFVLVVELLNTAIEKLADRVNLAIDPQIGRVKDMGSAAVGLALLIAGITWLLALAERLGLI